MMVMCVFTKEVILMMMFTMRSGHQIHFVSHNNHRDIGHISRLINLLANCFDEMEAGRNTDVVDQ